MGLGSWASAYRGLAVAATTGVPSETTLVCATQSTPMGGQHADKAPLHRCAAAGTDRDRRSAGRDRRSRIPAPPPWAQRGRPDARTHRLDGLNQPRTDPRHLERTNALSVRQGQERQERLLWDVRELLAAADRDRR